MSPKRNHHLQPNFYLKGFRSSEEGNPKVWVYEKGKCFNDGKNEKLANPKHLTTQKAARKRDFYAFDNEDGSRNFEYYENLLRDKFEEPAKPIIEQIRDFENSSLEEIRGNERKIFARYVASMIFRGEWWRKLRTDLQELYGSTDYIREYSLERSVGLNEHQSFEIRDILRRKIGYRNKKETLENMERKIEQLSPYVVDMRWRFLITTKDVYFLTADNPVWYRNLKDIAVGELLFPISSKIAFSASWVDSESRRWNRRGHSCFEVDDQTVERARECIAGFALERVYSPKKAEWLVEFINNKHQN